jgi:EAL domain-containing protein (putative c-di-GMP-specific phosphodiesterase class I)
VFCVNQKAGKDFEKRVLVEIAAEIRSKIAENIKKKINDRTFHDIELHMGCSVIEVQPKTRLERLINKAIKNAYLNMYERSSKNHIKSVSRLKRILKEERFINFFQPIVNLNDFSIFGYEALLRIKDEIKRENPLVLLKVSIEEGMIFEVERMMKVAAVREIKKLEEYSILFLNFEACVLENLDRMLSLFEKLDFPNERIVIELTERTAVTNFVRLQNTINVMRERGFRFAIDDAGSGYASMESIAYLKPEFLKIDLSIVRDIHINYIKQDIVLALKDLAKRTGAVLLAEGIEKKEEFRVLKAMEIQYGQGFLFARPSKKPVKKIKFS